MERVGNTEVTARHRPIARPIASPPLRPSTAFTGVSFGGSTSGGEAIPMGRISRVSSGGSSSLGYVERQAGPSLGMPSPLLKSPVETPRRCLSTESELQPDEKVVYTGSVKGSPNVVYWSPEVGDDELVGFKQEQPILRAGSSDGSTEGDWELLVTARHGGLNGDQPHQGLIVTRGPGKILPTQARRKERLSPFPTLLQSLLPPYLTHSLSPSLPPSIFFTTPPNPHACINPHSSSSTPPSTPFDAFSSSLLRLSSLPASSLPLLPFSPSDFPAPSFPLRRLPVRVGAP